VSRLLLLDLFCGAGGAAMGYHRAGFDVVGVDIAPQPHYPFEFHQGDALDWLRWLDGALDDVTVVHASPPCQAYSAMSSCRPGLRDTYERLIPAVRGLLDIWGGPYVIENVTGADLITPTTLCGQMFGLELYRHRLFESSFCIYAPPHPRHVVPASRAGHWKPGTIMSVAGHVAPIAKACEVMGIDWMNRDELTEAIPPAYTEFIGAQLLAHIQAGAA
jgi:DNA (cytosine-5)-methyltransferase 1